eukprot:COSAG04_NODE_23060_length_344_cov_1.355102_1_plen_33_part_01
MGFCSGPSPLGGGGGGGSGGVLIVNGPGGALCH